MEVGGDCVPGRARGKGSCGSGETSQEPRGTGESSSFRGTCWAPSAALAAGGPTGKEGGQALPSWSGLGKGQRDSLGRKERVGKGRDGWITLGKGRDGSEKSF